MIFKIFFFSLSTVVCHMFDYKLIFDKKLSPPHSVPFNPLDIYYSVPLNQTISKAIIAYIVDSKGDVVTNGHLSNAVFSIQSINADTAERARIKDEWAENGGKLCQRAVWWEDFPKRLDRSQAKERCGVYPNATMLTVQAFKGRLIIDWLFHSHINIPHKKRKLRIAFEDLKIYTDSYPIQVFEPAARIVITSQPPPGIEANTDFSLSAEIRDRNNKLITDGLDSIAFVELTVPYYYKTFYREEGKNMIVKSTYIRLSGANVTVHQSTDDYICRQRASGGIIKFNNIRILDAVSGLRLNLTMTMARDPWIRIPICPHCYDDTKDYNINADGTEISFRSLLSYDKIKSMSFTDAFRVTEQKLKKLSFSKYTLKYMDNLKVNGKIHVVRNVRIEHLYLEAHDASGKIIYSGKESSFELTYQTTPANVCISSDATKNFEGGGIYIYFSICQSINNVIIRISTHNGSIYVDTPSFAVSANINIVHFGDLQSRGSDAEIDFEVDNYIRFAVMDVNQGLQAKSLFDKFGLTLNITSYNTEGSPQKAMVQLTNSVGTRLQPAKKPHIIIGTDTDDIVKMLNPELNKIRMPYISVTNMADVFANVNKYPFFSRVCWSEYSTTQSVLLAFKQRMWTNVILVRTERITIGDTFRKVAADMGINIKQEVMIKDVSSENQFHDIHEDLRLDQEMRLIKSYGSKIILLFALKKNQPYILRAAHLSNLDTSHGYQWVLMSVYAWNFPFQNEGVCAKPPTTCTSAFRGTFIFTDTYNISGYQMKELVRVIGRYYSTDRSSILGGTTGNFMSHIQTKIFLGYDAVLLFANALIQILEDKKSLTGEAIAEYLRKVNVEGLTGNIQLNENGDRKGYMGVIGQLLPDKNNVGIESSLVPIRLLTYKNNTQYEIPYRNDQGNGFLLIPSEKYNTRQYESYTGLINPVNQIHIHRPGEDWPAKVIVREEKVLPPFYCNGSCGYYLLSNSNINIYDTGECTEKGICSCHPSYTGEECKSIVCNCVNGICNSLTNCTCSPGWNGSSCDIAQCSECVHGECVNPEVCTCHSTTWIGSACHIHIATVLVPTLIFSILLILSLIYYARKTIHRMQRDADLCEVDWIVDWSTVTGPLQRNLTISQSRTSIMSRSIGKTYTWKEEQWHVRFFDNRTMNSNDEDLCLEMVRLKKMKHRNLIVYGGACLEAPNVSLLLEPSQKGSLNDLLHMDSIDLGWDFRYSFMKDICSGMLYLHEKTDLGSHGRLKSHNCLVDSHWTIRLSGFGAPIMRYGKYRNESEYDENIQDLLWTAPEFLRFSKCLDDVRNGSKAGDMYSFAIVVSEILTRAEPYDFELNYLDITDLIQLILGNNYPGLKNARKTWESIGGEYMLLARPILKKELLPEKVSARTRFKQMLDEAWHDNPLIRPTFETIINHLNMIYPTKKELIDNIMNLLASYSNNLEVIVLERKKELEANKERAEELLCEMMPHDVAYELKRNGKVSPESFESASVFFSDIVDFSITCQNSTPLQIVTLLNETYNMFDDVLDAYDVYKVETVNDSYMVFSRKIVEDEPNHAGEICTMALDLMSTVTTFIVPHQPRATLQLRIGINSGPVVTAVVGRLMPRYCLFGDTVNIASRMMTGSHALCIQISNTTAECLDVLGDYVTETRGELSVKGYGQMTTHWLWGKHNFKKKLPDLSLAISLSKHNFK